MKLSPEETAKMIAILKSKISGRAIPKKVKHNFESIPDEIKDIVEADDKKQEKPGIEDYLV